MTKIAETYIHLKLDVTQEFADAVRGYLYHRAKTYAPDFFKWDVSIYVRVEDGSFKAWVVVLVGAIYLGFSHYGSFRSGIDYTVKDARRFSDYVISTFIDEAGIPDERIFRLERRLGVPGKIQRLFKRIEKLENASRIVLGQSIKKDDGKKVIDQTVTIDMGVDQNELKRLKEDLISIFELLADDKDRDLLFESLPGSFKEQLPDDFSELLFTVPKKYAFRKEDAALPIPPKVTKLPPPQ